MLMHELDSGGGNACSGLDDKTLDELRAIAGIYLDANGFFMQLVNRASKMVGSAAKALPDSWEIKIEDASRSALSYAADAAFSSQAVSTSTSWTNRLREWANGEAWHRWASVVTGGLGGAGGIVTTLIDLPVTTTLILRSIQQIAADHGEDISAAEVRAECVKVFAMGGPLPEDDNSDTGLWQVRMGLTGAAISEILKVALPRFGLVVGEKALAQAVPLLGAIAGAGVNAVFMQYFQAMAHVHFRLRKLERDDDPDQIGACFERTVRALRTERAGAAHNP